MTHLNVEVKAHCHHPNIVRNYLMNNGAIFKGLDHQTDTYFNVSAGRLKLREGNIENNLIFYERNDEAGAKDSRFQLITVPDAKALKDVLTKSVGIKVVVDKNREIYFIRNVKFHIDQVADLGDFMEIEASNLHHDIPQEQLQKQCDFYLREFGIKEKDLIAVSYSDMLLAKRYAAPGILS